MSMQKNPLKHFEKIAKSTSVRASLSEINKLSDRTEATDGYRYLVSMVANETPSPVDDYPETQIFLRMLAGDEAGLRPHECITVTLNPHYVIDMMKAFIDMAPLKGMEGVTIHLSKNVKGKPVLFTSPSAGSTVKGMIMPRLQ